MTMISAMTNGMFEGRVEALKAELGSILAARIFEAEAVDFLWEARIRERYLGQHFDVCFLADDGETELSRIAILSAFEGEWHVASCLVDGDGSPVDLLWKRSFQRRDEAETAFLRAA
jgi:hypothetical protein